MTGAPGDRRDEPVRSFLLPATFRLAGSHRSAIISPVVLFVIGGPRLGRQDLRPAISGAVDVPSARL